MWGSLKPASHYRDQDVGIGLMDWARPQLRVLRLCVAGWVRSTLSDGVGALTPSSEDSGAQTSLWPSHSIHMWCCFAGLDHGSGWPCAGLGFALVLMRCRAEHHSVWRYVGPG